MLRIVGKAKTVADLFSGVGTFALPLARKAKVHAVEQDKPALAGAGGRGARAGTEARRHRGPRPVQAAADPGGAGALTTPWCWTRPGRGPKPRSAPWAYRGCPSIAYVSCDAASFARDAAILVKGGYRPGPVTPIDQFLWSSHIELVGGFHRPKGR